MQQQQIQTTNWSQTLEGLLTWGFTKLTSRKFWAATITAYALWLQGQYQAAGAVIAAYVGIEGTKDIVTAWGEAKAKRLLDTMHPPTQPPPTPGQPPPPPPQQPPAQPPAVQPAQVEPRTPWDVGGYHDRVLAKAETMGIPVTPATIFNKAKEMGWMEPAADLYQVRDFYLYLHDLQHSAHDLIEKQTTVAGPCATEAKELWTIRQEGYIILDTISDLQHLIQANVRWTVSIPPLARYMTRIGMTTNELMQTYFPAS
ncbi:hypothetical protein ES703_53461 [subsurface metagenome]